MEQEPVYEAEAAYAEVASGILSAISGPFGGRPLDTPWQCPWHGVATLPTNPFSGKMFKGNNVMALWAARATHNYKSHFWASEGAWKKHGGRVVNPKRGVAIFIPIMDDTDGRVWGKGAKGMGPLGGDPAGGIRGKLLGFKRGIVFNHDDVEGDIHGFAELEPGNGLPPRENAMALAKGYMKNRGPAFVEGGAAAFYSPAHDRVTMPVKSAFPNADRYVGVLLHELVHSTGSKNRMARNMTGGMGSKLYAQEELVAELGSAFLCASLGLPTELRDDHAAYVRSWITKLKDQKAAFFAAVRDGGKAADHIRAMAGLD